MSDLERELAHARHMTTAEHKPECSRLVTEDGFRRKHPDPECPGCVTDHDRAIWQQQADELAAYLAPKEAVDLFGEVGVEPEAVGE